MAEVHTSVISSRWDRLRPRQFSPTFTSERGSNTVLNVNKGLPRSSQHDMTDESIYLMEAKKDHKNYCNWGLTCSCAGRRDNVLFAVALRWSPLISLRLERSPSFRLFILAAVSHNLSIFSRTFFCHFGEVHLSMSCTHRFESEGVSSTYQTSVWVIGVVINLRRQP